MDGLTRSAVAALCVAFGLALVGVVVVERSDTRAVDVIGLACVVAGVMVAALTNTRRDDEHTPS